MPVRVPHGFSQLALPEPEWLPRGRSIRQLVGCLLGQIYYCQKGHNLEDAEPANLSSVVLRDIFGGKLQNKVMEYCIDHQLIIRDGSYSNKLHKSKRYCWHPRFHGQQSEPFEITDRYITQALDGMEEVRAAAVMQDPAVVNAVGMFSHITIDTQGALTTLKAINETNEESVRQHEYEEQAIMEIAGAEWRISRERPMQGRIHTNFTNLKSVLRPYVRIDGHPIGGIDIKSCFPAMVLRLAQQSGCDPLELQQWGDWLDGDFYRTLGNLVREDRSRTKRLFQIWLHESDRRKVSIEPQMLELFPSIARFLRSRRNGSRGLHDLLSGLEANLMIEWASPRLAAEGIHHFTVHDGVFAPLEHLDRVQQVVEEGILVMGLRTRAVRKD